MMRGHTRVLGWCTGVLAATVFCLLGAWQLQRMAQKEALLAAAEHAHTAAAVSLARALDVPGATVQRIADQGRFLPGVVLLDNQMRHGRAGVKVYRPFQSTSGRVVLADLGWRLLPPDRTLPAVPPPPSPVHVQGLLAPAPAPGLALGPAISTAGPQRWLAARLQPETLAAVLAVPALPARVLRLDPALPFGDERDLDLLPNTLPPERHLGYAAQWFGLALTVLIVALLLEWRSRR